MYVKRVLFANEGGEEYELSIDDKPVAWTDETITLTCLTTRERRTFSLDRNNPKVNVKARLIAFAALGTVNAEELRATVGLLNFLIKGSQ